MTQKKVSLHIDRMDGLLAAIREEATALVADHDDLQASIRAIGSALGSDRLLPNEIERRAHELLSTHDDLTEINRQMRGEIAALAETVRGIREAIGTLRHWHNTGKDEEGTIVATASWKRCHEAADMTPTAAEQTARENAEKAETLDYLITCGGIGRGFEWAVERYLTALRAAKAKGGAV